MERLNLKKKSPRTNFQALKPGLMFTKGQLISKRIFVLKRGSLLGNEEPHLGGDSPIFEMIYSNLEQRSIFS